MKINLFSILYLVVQFQQLNTPESHNVQPDSTACEIEIMRLYYTVGYGGRRVTVDVGLLWMSDMSLDICLVFNILVLLQ